MAVSRCSILLLPLLLFLCTLPPAHLRLRPLRAPHQSRLLRLVSQPRRRFLRVRRGGRVPQRRPARRGRPGPVQTRRRLRRVLPGAVQRRGALRYRRREGRRHRPRQDEDERHRPRAEQPGVRCHGPPRHGWAARQARRRRRRVQEGAVRVRGQEPLAAGG
uniref:Uncharacterized protein n=1 Tax=Triticum urartu TaxID=4572 RepID=A0A8R7QMX4_TRIUA